MKRIIGVFVVAALLLGWGPRPASASSAAHHRLQGAAIALGALGLIAVISDAVQAQPVAVGVGVSYPGYAPPVYCPPPLPRPYAPVQPPARVWVPGYWDVVDIWVPAAGWAASAWGGSCRGDCDDHYRGSGHGHRGRHDHDGYGPGGHSAGRARGHYKRQRVWREGHYR